MTPTAMMMASAITVICSAMPTAVITESSEKTMSSTAIWARTEPKVAAALPRCWVSSVCSILWWISRVLLKIRKAPPTSRMMSFQEIARSPPCSAALGIMCHRKGATGMVRIGAVRLMIHLMENSSSRRMPMASSEPEEARLAALLPAAGGRPESR